ncbi:MAG: redoxin family protein [Opitutales bacterium]|nr:redoxin family protein [Opitutales bacterium]MCH8539374.1 redoxin family protein [Opitutales bacterium]
MSFCKKFGRLICAGVLAGLFAVVGNASTVHEWVDTEGRSMQAALVEVVHGHAVFERNGQTYRFPLQSLSEESQQKVRALEAQRVEKEKKRQAEKERAKKWQKVYGQLQGNLVVPRGRSTRSFDDSVLAEKQYFVFYYTASWCPPCRRFTPNFVEFYERLKKEHDTVAFIIASSDRSHQEMVKYMTDSGMPWPALSQSDRSKVPVVAGNATRGIPGIVMVNGKGEVLATTANSSRSAVMRKIESVLADSTGER